MSRPVADYNGHWVAPSKPVKTLRTVRKTFTVSSADRNTSLYYTNGDFVVYLPRVYENVVCLKLKSAEFPPLIANSSPGALTHKYIAGMGSTDYKLYKTSSPSTLSDTPNGDIQITYNTADIPPTGSLDGRKYERFVFNFYIDLEGLNKADETVVAAQRSAFPDNYFAKIPAEQTGDRFIEYNANSNEEAIAYYQPAIGKLDRLHIRTRLHSQQDHSGFIYWTSDGLAPTGGTEKGAEYTLTFEIEYLENGFDDFSSFETRLSERGHFGVGC